MSDAPLASEPTHELVTQVVTQFYAAVRQDAMLGPIFEDRLAGKWDHHLSKMVDFWSSLTMQTGTYFGKPHAAHFGLGLTAEHFQHWLELFDATVAECCAGHAAELFRDRARRVAASLQIGLNIGPHALELPPRTRPVA
jgi:hemoglobin